MVVHTSLFNCMCVKELWLLLRFVTEYLHDDNPKVCFSLSSHLLSHLLLK